jgi:hypothetical protein
MGKVLQQLVVVGLVALSHVAVGAPRTPPTRAAIAEARAHWARAQSLREIQIPLLEARATRELTRAMAELDRSGVKLDRKTPIVFDSSRELAEARRVSELLRGARPGGEGYELRKQAVLRVRELGRTMYGMPRQMNAYTNAAKGSVELAINLDNPFYGTPEKLLPVIAHEHRHIRDAKRALRIETLLANEKTLAPRQVERLKATVERLWSHPRAETRAFEAQAFALALTGRPLGNWWRAPAGGPIDQAYPPAQLNRALVRGYLKGLGQKLGPALAEATPRERALSARYLAGYKAVLEAQATAFYQAVRKDEGRDATAIDRYNAAKTKVFAKAARPGSLTGKRAFLVGQADAYLGNAPLPRVQELLAR